MSFEDVANLAGDGVFNARLGSCVMIEALGRPTDELADLVISNQTFWGAAIFVGPVSAAPGFGDMYAGGGQAAINDADILAAVQADWERVKSVRIPAATP